jgi:glycosyltransferase involved in cell wall biosynthesis
VIYSSTTAALLWPLPGAIRFDACAAANRPGRHGLWQRPLERRRLAASTLLLPWSEGALRECPPAVTGSASSAAASPLVVPVAVAPSGPPAPERDVAAVTYAANPLKKGFDRVLAAWRRLRADPAGPLRESDQLHVIGSDPGELERAGVGVPGEGEGVRLLGTVPHEQYRALLRRARVFVCAPRREDYGIAQLEALADGCMLVTTEAPGPYVALAPARAADSRLVGEDLVAGLRAALAEPLGDYSERTARALEPYGPAALAAVVQRELVPRLLGAS